MPSTCKSWITLDLNFWVVFDLSCGCCLGFKSFGKMFIWKKQSGRELLLCLAFGGTNSETLLAKSTFRRGSKFLTLAHFFLSCEAVWCSLNGGQCIVLLQTGGWKKRKTKTLSWGFALICISLNIKKVKEKDMGPFHSSLYLSFISSSDHLSHPSLCQAPGGHSPFSVLRGLVFPGCWQHVADRLSSLF